MARDLLDAAHSVTAEQAIDIAFSPQVWHAELWQERVRRAAPQHEVAKLIAGWNRRSDADSRAALAFYIFKMALGGATARATEPPADLTDEAIRQALDRVAVRLQSEPADSVFGTLFRVGRRDSARTFPVGGGTLMDAGMATPRAISFSPRGKEMVGHTGQTSTQIVILSKPPQSYMVLPLGESDHADSAHYDDQAEKLFSKSKAKSTYFANRKELEKHVTSRKTLMYM
jgi:acyl-homoserine lactone acylase PvdQ